MAYTYDDFLTAATAGGRLNSFSEADLEITKKNPEYGLSMLKLMDDADSATTDEARLLTQSAMEQLRTNYGSTAPTTYDGRVGELLGEADTYGSFSYSGETEYQKLLDEVANYPSFSYDAASDPSYQAYRKMYLREGDRATENALAKASAATGGTPSSYAVTAATQAGNYHAAQLADKLPELQQLAYQQYLQDFALKQEKLSALASDRALSYDEWLQDYNMINQNLSNYQGAAATEWQKYLDEAELERQAELAKQNAASTEESLKQQRYENALALYKILGYATPEIAAILGIPEGTTLPTGTGGDTGTGDDPVDPWTDPTYYNNEGLEEWQIKVMQNYFQVEDDGLWGQNSKAAAGDKTAKEAWDYYQQLLDENGGLSENRKDEIQDWVTSNIIDKIDKMPAGYDPKRVIEKSGVFTSEDEMGYAWEILQYLLTLR